MGRAFEMKNGRKQFAPTALQLKKMESAQKLKQYIDDTGHSGNFLATSSKERIKEFVEYAKSLTPEQIHEIFKKGMATDEFATLVTLRAYLDDKKGIFVDHMNDPKFKFNLERMNKEFAKHDIEHMACYDKNNRFLGITVGTEKQVSGNVHAGMLVGGTITHNHPTQKTTGLGGSFSIKGLDKNGSGDLLVLRDAGLKTIHATTKEGLYTMTAPSRPTFTNKDLNTLLTKTMAESHKAYEFSKTAPAKLQKTVYARIDATNYHKALTEFASKHGLIYKFTPNKGYENLHNPAHITHKLPK